MKHLIFLLFIPIFSLAQVSTSTEITYEVGSPYPVVDAYSKQYFEKDGEILTFKVKKKEYILQKLDAKTMKFISIRNYTDLPKDHAFEGIEEINGKYYFFYSIWDKPNLSEQLFVKEIDFASGKMNGKEKRIIKTKGKVTGLLARTSYFSIKVLDKFDISKSTDESILMIKYRKKPAKRNDDVSHDIIGFHVFDSDLNPIWDAEIKMPYTEKKMNNIDYATDSYGNTYILTTVYKDDTTKRFKKNGSINYHMELLKIDAKSQTLSKTKIELKDQHINRMWIYESEKGKIVCAGFYNDGKDADDAEGIFVAQIDEGNNLVNVNAHEIPVEVLNLYKKKRTQAKNEKKEEKGKKTEFEELQLRKFITRSDGSVILVGEQYYVKEHTSYRNGQWTTYYTYHYNDMLISKLNPDGSLAWMKILPKKQMGSAGQGGMGFKYFTRNSNHYLLILDNYKNLELSEDKPPKRHMDGAGGYLTAYKVTDDGTVSKISVLNVDEVPELKKGAVYQFGVDRIVNISENEFVVEFYKKKKEDILIKFKIN